MQSIDFFRVKNKHFPKSTCDGGFDSGVQERLSDPTLCSSTSLVTLEMLTRGASEIDSQKFHDMFMTKCYIIPGITALI